MDRLNRAVFMMEEDASIPIDGKPLMLEAVLDRSILERAVKQCMAVFYRLPAPLCRSGCRLHP